MAEYGVSDKYRGSSKRFDWIVPVVMAEVPHLSAKKMAQGGTPVPIVGKWARVRREMTRGLKRRVRENVN